MSPEGKSEKAARCSLILHPFTLITSEIKRSILQLQKLIYMCRPIYSMHVCFIDHCFFFFIKVQLATAHIKE